LLYKLRCTPSVMSWAKPVNIPDIQYWLLGLHGDGYQRILGQRLTLVTRKELHERLSIGSRHGSVSWGLSDFREMTIADSSVLFVRVVRCGIACYLLGWFAVRRNACLTDQNNLRLERLFRYTLDAVWSTPFSFVITTHKYLLYVSVDECPHLNPASNLFRRGELLFCI